MTFSLKPSANIIRASLKAHSGFGLFVAALMYLVCITGMVCIYYPDIERWEQADIGEYNYATPDQTQHAVENYLADYSAKHPQEKLPDNIWISLPDNDSPRFSIGAEEAQYFINADATLGEKVNHEWTHFITALHYSLTIPGIWGLTLVGILGMILVSMVISGLLAHPNLFKNAFSLRVQRGARQQQVDFHNRIGVWATPFILIIALTGAMIGLSQIILFIFSATFFHGNSKAITDDIFLIAPEPTNIAAPLINIADILTRFKVEHPDLRPSFINLHNPKSTAQSLEVSALMRNRLIFSESYLFGANSELIKGQDFTNGLPGAQIFNSTYRLHFGHFGGLPVKIIYTLLGLAMSFLCATGMNIWFRRQQQAGNPRQRLEHLWLAVVWGFPCAILVSAIIDFWWWEHLVAVFWPTCLVFFIGSQFIKTRQALSYSLRILLVVLTTLLLGLHTATFGQAAFTGASILINSLLFLLLLGAGVPLLIVILSATTNSKAAVSDSVQKPVQNPS